MKWVTAVMAMLVFSLVLVGLVVQASISDFRGRAIAGDPTHFILQQALYFVAGLICCFVIAAIHPEFWFRREVAAVVLLGSAAAGRRCGMPPLARIRSAAVAGVEPRLMGLGPVPAIRKALKLEKKK